ncbi:MAG: HAMP domain-containing sensor histidine kinase [Chloroflexota bacterium]
MTIPTNKDFATEVRSDRLKTLWQFTFAGCLIFFWVIATIATLQKSNAWYWLIAVGVWGVACLLTRALLKINRYAHAVWTYALGGVAAGAVILAGGDTTATQIIPFVFPLIVFVVGLLLPPISTLIIATLAVAAVGVMPLLNMESGGWGIFQLFAILLTYTSALLASQVTGELYQISEWALSNYQRERKTTTDLFESRQQLERALHRSEALSDELQETNTELKVARTAADDAKHFRGQFLANMSHELRTPLNAIIGFSETMLKFPAMYDDVTLPKGYEADLNQIYNSGRQLLSLINDILDLSKVDAGKLELHIQRVALEPICNMVVSTAQGLVGERSIKLLKDYTEPLPAVWADEGRVRQVLLNLYSNAVKFTESGEITLSVRETDEGVRISVKDSGKGIDHQFHEIIFEEFKQADAGGRDPRSGAGLGLAISRHLLGLMQGRIWVESEVGKGSTFNVVLPAYQELASKPKRTDVFPAIVDSGKSEEKVEKVV